jgi:hypothetical protein
MADPVRCPICKSGAAEIDRGLFDGVVIGSKDRLIAYRPTQMYSPVNRSPQ